MLSARVGSVVVAFVVVVDVVVVVIVDLLWGFGLAY